MEKIFSRHFQFLKLQCYEINVGVDQEVVPQGLDCNGASKLLVVGKGAGDVDLGFVEDVDVSPDACRSDREEGDAIVDEFYHDLVAVCLVVDWNELCRCVSYVFQ